jgi:hypothetical protein
MALVPFAFLSLVSAVLIFGMRRDAPSIGLALTWGASIVQLALGLALIVAALREAVPGTTLSRRVIGAALGTVLLAILTVTFLTWFASPTLVPSRVATFVWGVCFTGTIVGALPALALSGWLVSRAFPLRPGLAGALYGIGAGLMADGGWRLFCHFSHPLHVFGAHTLGVVAVGALGVVVGKRLAGTR